ncbi:importin-4 [Cocos nucifera]|uniref:Importin-4 n=1 Tax=Cocos nucifera TaxID=13894 RepID=A0A8K0I2T0_COCNU|nr:importin-4 [Cocos nucifera]
MAQSLELLLIQFLMPDNDARRQAEEQIKRLAKDPQVVPALVHHLRTAKTPNVRQLSAVLLRKKIIGHWAKLPSHVKHSVKSALIECITHDPSPPVRRASANVVSVIAKYAVPAGEWPDLLPFLFQCSHSAQEDHREVKLFREFIPSILNISRQCIANGEEDVASIAFEIFDELIESPAPLLGDSAIQIISWLAKYKASFLKKHKLVIPILQVMCPLLTETSAGEEDSDLAADRAAAEVIDTMAINIPKHVFPPVIEFASVNFCHIDPKYREASVTALGVVSEGCFELLKDKLEYVLNIVLGALKDQEQMVRGAAAFALGQFAEYLQPEILSHYGSVLPCILNALEDPSDEVKEKSYYALAAFCEDMGEEILPYLDPLMGRLITTLQSSPRSVASAAEQAFIPYAEKVLELMKSFMVLTNDEDLRSRARATELVGMIAMAVGRTRMEPILPPFIEAALSGFALDFSELREYTHGFFSNIAEILDDGFTQYLPHVVPLVFSSCNLDDGSAVDIDDADSIDNGSGGVSSDDDANDEPRDYIYKPFTYKLDNVLVVVILVGVGGLAQSTSTRSSFGTMRHYEKVLRNILVDSSLKKKILRLGLDFCGMRKSLDVLTAAQAIPSGHSDVSEKQKEILDTTINICIKTMTEDDDKEVVAQACMSAADIMTDCGYAALESYIPRLAEATLTLLRGESSCQQVESDTDTEGDIDHDEVLMDAVSDLLPAFAKAMGSHFEPIFAKLFDPLMKFASLFTQIPSCPMLSVCQRMFSFIWSRYYGDILRSLWPLFGESEPDDAVRDNAAGAVARMIMVQPQSIPLNQVLPVFLKALPLKEDREESLTVYSCICNLLLSSNPQILPLVPDVVQIFAQVVVSPAESDEVKAQVGMAISHLISVYGQQMQPVLSALSPAQANALAAYASKR